PAQDGREVRVGAVQLLQRPQPRRQQLGRERRRGPVARAADGPAELAADLAPDGAAGRAALLAGFLAAREAAVVVVVVLIGGLRLRLLLLRLNQTGLNQRLRGARLDGR